MCKGAALILNKNPIRIKIKPNVTPWLSVIKVKSWDQDKSEDVVKLLIVKLELLLT